VGAGETGKGAGRVGGLVVGRDGGRMDRGGEVLGVLITTEMA